MKIFRVLQCGKQDFDFDFDFDKLNMIEDLYGILKLITNEYDLIFVHWTWGFYSHVRQDVELKNKLIKISKNIPEE